MHHIQTGHSTRTAVYLSIETSTEEEIQSVLCAAKSIGRCDLISDVVLNNKAQTLYWNGVRTPLMITVQVPTVSVLP